MRREGVCPKGDGDEVNDNDGRSLVIGDVDGVSIGDSLLDLSTSSKGCKCLEYVFEDEFTRNHRIRL